MLIHRRFEEIHRRSEKTHRRAEDAQHGDEFSQGGDVLVIQADAHAEGAAAQGVLGGDGLVEGTHKPVGTIALELQREVVGQLEAGTPVIGIVVEQVGHEHLLGYGRGGVGQLQVGLRREVIACKQVEPQVVAQGHAATL